MSLNKPTTKLKSLLSDPWCSNADCKLSKRKPCGRRLVLLPVSIKGKYQVNEKYFEPQLIGSPLNGSKRRLECLAWFPEEISLDYIKKFVK